ncbi:metallophosphoesterase [Lentisphaera profundi]|uniref:Metallophosphoesterase n=1 Tax=Lentisphaera profundi TaxID=1658616 RepID=A0ABY7VWT7_9BACT|nr:metallophosphoesterase [Lentisphaera profundi]WDE98705.1 metallophosphoesterase [Lentisphaera profundi]
MDQSSLEARSLRELKQAKKGDSLKKRLIKSLVNLSGLGSKGLKNALELQVRDYNWRFPALPREAVGMRLLHLSDTHLDGVPGLVDKLIEKLDGLEFDLVVWTGDFRYDKGVFDELCLEPTYQLARYLKNRSRVLAVPGNHDCSQTLESLEVLGIEVLLNSGLEYRAGFFIAGVDDPHYYRTDDLKLALRKKKENDFTMLLAHSPEIIEEAAARRIDFYLCGHTHGGQVCFPLVGMIYWGARCARKFASGKFNYGKMQGYTHRGTGSSNSPIRFNCPPEIVIHQLGV